MNIFASGAEREPPNLILEVPLSIRDFKNLSIQSVNETYPWHAYYQQCSNEYQAEYRAQRPECLL